MTPVIKITNLKKHFGKVKAVDGISFEIQKGEVFGFLGPNGAGKTTTIRCLMDFIRPTEGEIKILDHDAHLDSVFLKSRIGYLPGNVKLYGKWTGWDHIRFVESIRGRSKTVNDLIKKFDYNPKARFYHLSSGNKQKLGLILALMNEPEILIMDEPTVGLDPLLQNLIYEVLEDLRKKGTTIFVSSHNLPEVERICDRVGIIKAGKMVEVESIAELGEKKLHKIEVRLEDKFDKKEFQINGVDRIEEVTDGLIITVSGQIDPVIKKLAKHHILDLEVTHGTLEDVFLKFYEKDK
ncbi:MAG: ABC transporter ATP-binding protein [Patescibacteria group bacterium]|nr:ABC transporter ATP-binding protein [Patescibacteria group bacterium]